MTKFKGTGFYYYYNGIKLKDYDEWERKIKNIEVTTDVVGLELRAKTVKKKGDE